MDNENDNPPSCMHNEKHLRCMTYSNGSKHFVMQCQHCGSKVEVVRKATIASPASVLPFDDKLRESWREHLHKFYEDRRAQRQAEYERERQERSSEWWQKYNQYLTTPKWEGKRQRVLERDNRLCQACLVRKATQVHHLTYEHVCDEPLFDLVAICDTCHKHLHGETL